MHGILPIICDPRLFEYFVRVCLFTTESTNHLFCPHTKSKLPPVQEEWIIVTHVQFRSYCHVLQYYSSIITPTGVLANTNTHIWCHSMAHRTFHAMHWLMISPVWTLLPKKATLEWHGTCVLLQKTDQWWVFSVGCRQLGIFIPPHPQKVDRNWTV